MNKYSRRKFIYSGSLAIGGLALSTGIREDASVEAEVVKQAPIKVGVIGTGNRGTGLISLINDIPTLEVAACADIIPFRLSGALAKTKQAKGYADYRGLLDDKQVDAVIISTPYGMHGKMALDALNAGKHVFCEKAMVRGHEETQAVVDKVGSGKQIFMTGHQHRSSPLVQKIGHIISSGYIGKIVAIDCQWHRNNDWRRPVPDPKWERMINWRMYREYSGGLVAELLSHQIDLANWFTGSYPIKYTGIGGIDHWKDGRETFDNVYVLCEYPNGVKLTLTSNTGNAYGGFEIKILGRKGTIILNRDKANIYVENTGKSELGIVDGVSGATIKAWEKGEGAPIDGDGKNPSIHILEDFAKAIHTQEQPVSNVKTGALVSKSVDIILDALYSENAKKWTDYPEITF